MDKSSRPKHNSNFSIAPGKLYCLRLVACIKVDMKTACKSILALAALTFAGCDRPTWPESAGHHGRYVGIGIYSPDEGWSRVPAPAGDPAAAKPKDDSQVIVVVDSNTGEVRQCGNMSGHCIGMNPWAKDLSSGQSLPVRLAPAPTQQPAASSLR